MSRLGLFIQKEIQYILENDNFTTSDIFSEARDKFITRISKRNISIPKWLLTEKFSDGTIVLIDKDSSINDAITISYSF